MKVQPYGPHTCFNHPLSMMINISLMTGGLTSRLLAQHKYFWCHHEGQLD